MLDLISEDFSLILDANIQVVCFAIWVQVFCFARCLWKTSHQKLNNVLDS